jgi:hypothetical protein
MIILIALLLLISLFFECYGFIFRHLGAINNSSSLGYSLHVQIATIARFGTLLSYPLIAYKLETGVTNNTLSIIPIISFSLLAITLYIFLKNKNLNNVFSFYILKKLSNISGYQDIFLKRSNSSSQIDDSDEEISKSEKFRLVYFGTFSFLFTSSSFFLTSILANQFLEYRATIIQCTPFISSVGTIMSVVYFDPTLSKLIDKNPNSFRAVKLAWQARIRGSIIIALIFIFLFSIL